MSTIRTTKGTDNVYADLGMADAQEMLVKAKLASKIGELLKRLNLTQQQAAELLAMPQPKISQLMRGQFRGISEAKMLECLARLGRDGDIVVKLARRSVLKLQELRAAVEGGARSGRGKDANEVLDRLERKYRSSKAKAARQ